MTARSPTIAPPASAEGVEKDRVLLAAFLENGDERAFAELVRRHAGLVYHAALRRTGDAGLAEEVAQSTFALMARKAAKLTHHPFPAGWLHRTATWLAGDAAAREDAHRRRMKRFSETAALHAAGDDPMESALPHLDKALDSLRESDRRLIWMRFHEGLSFQVISDRLRQPQEAARKATQRAVGRLGQALRRSGVTLSTVALTSALSGILTSPAPAALMGNLPAASLAAAGTTGGKTLLLHIVNTMTTAKQIAAAAVLVTAFAVPVLALQESVSRQNPAGRPGSSKTSGDGAGQGAAAPRHFGGDEQFTPRSAWNLNPLLIMLKSDMLGEMPCSSADGITNVFASWPGRQCAEGARHQKPLKRLQGGGGRTPPGRWSPSAGLRKVPARGCNRR